MLVQGNSIQYDSTGVIVNNFGISQGNQSLNINSTAQSTSAPIKVDLKNFEICNHNKTCAPGFFACIRNNKWYSRNYQSNNKSCFYFKHNCCNLTYKLDTIGNVQIKVNNQTANAYNADVAITGNGNDVHLTGTYYTGEGRMDLNLLLNSLNLGIVKPFAVGQLDDITGILKGNVKIQGTTTNPSVDGQL